MKFAIHTLSLVFALSAATCSKPKSKPKEVPTKPKIVKPSLTAFSVIEQVHDSLEANCGKDMPVFDPAEIEKLELSEEEQERADQLLEMTGLMAQQCAVYDAPKGATDTCNPDCSWCPVKWYWCIENAGACAGGDNKACCKLGACGSKHHCEDVCKSSCGCDVPPLPPDSGGGGDDD